MVLGVEGLIQRLRMVVSTSIFAVLGLARAQARSVRYSWQHLALSELVKLPPLLQCWRHQSSFLVRVVVSWRRQKDAVSQAFQLLQTDN